MHRAGSFSCLLLTLLLSVGAHADVAVTPAPPAAPVDVAKLRAAIVDVAAKGYTDALARAQAGAGTLEVVLECWFDAERAVDASPAAARAALGRYADRARKLEVMARDRSNAGTMTMLEVTTVQWWRMQAELALATTP